MAVSLDVMSVPEAARELGVNSSRVRALLAGKELDGEKVGGRWLVRSGSVRERKRSPRRRGRRLRPANAWAVLALASREDAPWVGAEDRRRLARMLDERGFVALVDRLGDRARLEGFYAHPGVLTAIQGAPSVVPAGSHAARDEGERLVPGGDVDFYISEADLPGLIREYALERSDQPNALARVLPHGLWPFDDRRMPLAAIAVDLADMPDARSRRIGHRLMERIEADH